MIKRNKILIAGGSGFIGSTLNHRLTKAGYTVQILSRKKPKEYELDYRHGYNSVYYWNPLTKEIDSQALKDIDVLINLSGAGIADKLWTNTRKKELWNSRINSTRFLVEEMVKHSPPETLLINASAIGYYGNRPDEIIKENSKAGSDFLASLCVAWEAEAKKVSNHKFSLTLIRIGIVLGNKGGSFPFFKALLKRNFNILFGNGKHHISWIHLQDLITIFEQIINGTLPPGTYNATTNNAVSQAVLNKEILKHLQKKALRICFPEQLLRILPGDMRSLFNYDQNIYPGKLEEEGFKFQFGALSEALDDLIKNS